MAEERYHHHDLHKPRYWPSWLLVSWLWLLAQLPWRMQLWLGKHIGLLAYVLAASRRNVAQTNVRLCFSELSENEQHKLVKRIFIENGRGLLETMLAWFRPADTLIDKTDIIGLEKVATCQEKNQGVILLGAHYSVLDLAGALLSERLRFSVSYRPQNNPVVNWVMRRGRARLFESCLTRKDVRGFIRTLKDGGILWYAQDQDFGERNSVFVPFFGVPTATITATSRIAKASGAAVLPISYFRKDNHQGYVIEIHDALEFNGQPEHDAELANAFLEQQIRRYPAQYLWLHKRFKTQPEGARGDLYHN